MAKGPEAFRTISEAAEELDVPQHVLRFWETKFSFIRPMKRAGGRRFYRPQDIAVLQGVRRLLHDEGYTIKGVQKLHKDQGLRRLLGEMSDVGGDTSADLTAWSASSSAEQSDRLEDVRDRLAETKRRLDEVLNSAPRKS